jgi:GNAT superfamily N-acetyltransferase
VANYLNDDICQPRNHNNLITALDGDRLVALMTYSDLDWDTRHYGYKSGYIQYLLTDNSLDQNLIRQSLYRVLSLFKQRCRDKKIEFVSADLDSWDFMKSFALQRVNFKYILTQIDGFVKEKIDPIQVFDDVEVSSIKSDEIEYFEKLAAHSYFFGGRFYADPGFDRVRVDQMYANLVRSSYENGQILLSYRVNGKPVGLFICKRIVSYPHFGGLRVAPLRFLIVDPQFRGRKIAQDLFIQTVNYLKDSCDLVETGLEIHNMPSLNLHVNLSFSFNYTHNAYHWRIGS